LLNMSRRTWIFAGVGVLLLWSLLLGKLRLNFQRAADRDKWTLRMAQHKALETKVNITLLGIADSYPTDPGEDRPAGPTGIASITRFWPLISSSTMPKSGGGHVDIDQFRTPLGPITLSIDGASVATVAENFSPSPTEHVSTLWQAGQMACALLAVSAAIAWLVALVHAILERPVRKKGTVISVYAAIAMLTMVLASSNDAGQWGRLQALGALICLGMLAGSGALALWTYLRPALRPGMCRACGYDLTGNISGVCPECGRPIQIVQEHGSQHRVAEG